MRNHRKTVDNRSGRALLVGLLIGVAATASYAGLATLFLVGFNFIDVPAIDRSDWDRTAFKALIVVSIVASITCIFVPIAFLRVLGLLGLVFSTLMIGACMLSLGGL